MSRQVYGYNGFFSFPFVFVMIRIKAASLRLAPCRLLSWMCRRYVAAAKVAARTWLPCLWRPPLDEALPVSSSDVPSEIIRTNARARFEKKKKKAKNKTVFVISFGPPARFFAEDAGGDKARERGGQFPRMRFAHISLVLLSAQLMFTAYWIIHPPLIWVGFNVVLLYQEDAGFS